MTSTAPVSDVRSVDCQRSLDEYLRECAGETDDDDDLDVSTPSAWRASANSPLRGSAKLRSGQRLSVESLRQEMALSGKSNSRLSDGLHDAPPTVSKRVQQMLKEAAWPLTAVGSSSPSTREDTHCCLAAQLLVDSLSAIGQRPCRMFRCNPTNGTQWDLSPAGRRAADAMGRTSCGGIIAAWVQETIALADEQQRFELSLASLHPASMVSAEDAHFFERWSPLRQWSSVSTSQLESDGTTTTSLSSSVALRRASYCSLFACHSLLASCARATRLEILSLQESTEKVLLDGNCLRPDCADCREGVGRAHSKLIMSCVMEVRQNVRSIASTIHCFHELVRKTLVCSDMMTTDAALAAAARHGVFDNAKREAVEVVCGRWMNALTQRVSLHQPTTTSTPSASYLCAVALFLSGSWAWLETLSWAITGVVPVIDEQRWVSVAPSVFTHPFPVANSGHSNSGHVGGDHTMRKESAVSLVASCEGIVRHCGNWRESMVARVNTLQSLLADVCDAVTPAASNRTTLVHPLAISVGQSHVIQVRCSTDPLALGLSASCVTAATGQQESSEPRGMVFLDTSAPAEEWVLAVLVRPLATQVQRSQRLFLFDLISKKVPLPLNRTAAMLPSDGRRPTEPHESTTSLEQGVGRKIAFRDSLQLVCRVALLAEHDEALTTTLIGKLFSLPPSWWVVAPRLAVDAFAECVALLFDDNKGDERQARRHSIDLAPCAVMKFSADCEQRAAALPGAAGLLVLLQGVSLAWNLPEQHAVVLLPHLYYETTKQREGDGAADDAFSKIFRLQLSLLIAKRMLVEHWKTSRWVSLKKARSYSAGGMHLAYLIDTLLRYVAVEVRIVASTLQTAVEQENTCVANVCRHVDEALAHLDLVSLQSSHDSTMTASRLILQSVVALLRMTFELYDSHKQLAAEHQPLEIASRTRSVASSLVAALRSVPDDSPLHARVQPLLLQLTFNGFFADAE